MVVSIHVHRQRQLLLVVDTKCAVGSFLRLGEGRQQQTGKNGDDGDNDEQFDQGESVKYRPRTAVPQRAFCSGMITVWLHEKVVVDVVA